jgi:hypothetical protein
MRKPDDMARQALRYWHEALGLQAWNITMDVAYTLSVPASEAEIAVNWETETANLAILHPDVYKSMGLYSEQDIERAVVHELLHILWDPVEPANREGMEWRMFEQILDRTARALIAARRGK